MKTQDDTTALEHLVKAVALALTNPPPKSGASYTTIRLDDQDVFALRLALQQAEAELARRSAVSP